MIIGKVEFKHEGNYSCTAHNNNGLLSKWAYVSVVSKYPNKTNTRNTTSVNLCSQETCVYGSCIQQNSTSFCKCPPAYSGVNCDLEVQRKNNSEPCLTFQNNKEYSFIENKMLP